MSKRHFALAAALLTGTLAFGTAQARPDVQWQVSIETPTIRLPGHVVLPLPPIPVPRAVVVAPQRNVEYRGNPRWDVDGDGIPNRYDRYPYDPRNGRGWREHRDEREYRDRHEYRDQRDWRDHGDRRDWRDDREGHRH